MEASVALCNSGEHYFRAEQKVLRQLNTMVEERIALCKQLIEQLGLQLRSLEEQAASHQTERVKLSERVQQLLEQLKEFNPKARFDEGHYVASNVMTPNLKKVRDYKKEVARHRHYATVDTTAVVRPILSTKVSMGYSFGNEIGSFSKNVIKMVAEDSREISDRLSVYTSLSDWQLLHQWCPQYKREVDNDLN